MCTHVYDSPLCEVSSHFLVPVLGHTEQVSKAEYKGKEWRPGTSQALGGSNSLSTSGTPEKPGDSNMTENGPGWESHKQR